MEFADYLQKVAASFSAHSKEEWRVGQTYFNVLQEMRPDIAKEVRGNELDPFYMDSVLPQFLAYVEVSW